MTGIYRPTGPLVKGTKKDGTPRTFYGKKPKVEHLSLFDYLLPVQGPGHVSVTTAEGMSLVSFEALGPERLRALEVGMDYLDAANEDAFGRLPHEAGFGSPLHLVPEPAPLPQSKPVRRAA